MNAAIHSSPSPACASIWDLDDDWGGWPFDEDDDAEDDDSEDDDSEDDDSEDEDPED